jgi:hypothetical protein
MAAAAVVMGIAVVVVGLLFTMAYAIRTMAVVKRSVTEITDRTLPLIADMHASIQETSTDLARVDTLLDTADSISATMDTAARIAYNTVSNPVVKAISAGTGIARAYRGFWRRRAAH